MNGFLKSLVYTRFELAPPEPESGKGTKRTSRWLKTGKEFIKLLEQFNLNRFDRKVRGTGESSYRNYKTTIRKFPRRIKAHAIVGLCDLPGSCTENVQRNRLNVTTCAHLIKVEKSNKRRMKTKTIRANAERKVDRWKVPPDNKEEAELLDKTRKMPESPCLGTQIGS